MMRHLLALGCLFMSLLAAPALWAQTGSGKQGKDLVPSSFDEKEKELLELIRRQKPQLKRVERRLADIEEKLNEWEDILQYRKKVPKIREEALKEISQLRRRNEKQYDQLKELNMQWFRHTRHLMAVYTRFGEMRVNGEATEQLKTFLSKHRQVLYQMEDLLVKVNSNFVDADYLLNTKLN